LKIGDCIGQKQRITPQGVIKNQEDLISATPLHLFGTREWLVELETSWRVVGCGDFRGEAGCNVGLAWVEQESICISD
jgi:hypothetical protein